MRWTRGMSLRRERRLRPLHRRRKSKAVVAASSWGQGMGFTMRTAQQRMMTAVV